MKKNKNKKDLDIAEDLKKYFEQAQNASMIKNRFGAQFESEKVYDNIIELIGDKQRKKAGFKRFLYVAASITIFFCISISSYYLVYDSTRQESMVMMESKTKRGEIIRLSLADGTSVYLNAESKLSYPNKFSGDKREVTLIGEAYFDVAHNAHKPFVIHTDKINTKVFGTSFNINAYPESKDIKVTVVTGKVGVYQSTTQKETEKILFITPNQQVVYNKASQLLTQSKPEVTALDLSGWHQRKMVYNNRLLSEVVLEVERSYNVDIAISDKLLKCKITANFNNASLDKVLKVLAKLADGNFSFKDGHYQLNGEGC